MMMKCYGVMIGKSVVSHVIRVDICGLFKPLSFTAPLPIPLFIMSLSDQHPTPCLLLVDLGPLPWLRPE